jgi:hypothetical protein
MSRVKKVAYVRSSIHDQITNRLLENNSELLLAIIKESFPIKLKLTNFNIEIEKIIRNNYVIDLFVETEWESILDICGFTMTKDWLDTIVTCHLCGEYEIYEGGFDYAYRIYNPHREAKGFCIGEGKYQFNYLIEVKPFKSIISISDAIRQLKIYEKNVRKDHNLKLMIISDHKPKKDWLELLKNEYIIYKWIDIKDNSNKSKLSYFINSEQKTEVKA